MIVPTASNSVGLLEGFYNRQCFLLFCGYMYQQTDLFFDKTVDDMSLLQISNSNGPSTVPCGTPDVTADSDNVTPATATFLVLFSINFLIR